MIRFMEANGYDVSYTTGIDVGTTAGGALTVQWAFGLDSSAGTPDPTMQQATVASSPTWASSRTHRSPG